uniref:F-box associated beta-propeller type 3 domain-containing protein n=1 Tax=Brassica oleracea TaxID=3712 RepID=A0A3P6FZ86_BRAOL|nr:unnamed protein product [Brassica oleracea]
MTLWVLEDAEKQEWSSMTCDLPSTWEDLLGFYVRSKGVSHTGELMVFYPGVEPSKPFYVCYYDFNKMRIRKVEIRGMVDGDFRRINGIAQINRCVYVYKTLKIISTPFTISCNGRFQGVSKLWLSIIRSKDYVDTVSSSPLLNTKTWKMTNPPPQSSADTT